MTGTDRSEADIRTFRIEVAQAEPVLDGTGDSEDLLVLGQCRF